jgi:hypothetical protein
VDPADRRDPVHHLDVQVAVAMHAVVRIPPALLVPDSRRVLEWEARRDYRLRECLPSRQDAPVHLHAGRDNVISMGPKKGR